jgi:hypothetical protein
MNVIAESGMKVVSGSFRDPSGQVFLTPGAALRSIQSGYAAHWEAATASGFLSEAVEKGLLIGFEEVDPMEGAWKTLRSPLLPFVSYPYEWSFGQLRDAALCTLDVLDCALQHGLSLKDATGYNVQYVGAKPVFIDLLSFEVRHAGQPWVGYLQFCRHFLAPLALMAKKSVLCGRMLYCWIEGIPLDLAVSLLPWITKFSPTLGIHLHMHAKMQAKYADARSAASKLKNLKMSDDSVKSLSQSLRMAVEGLNLPAGLKTEWGDYYTDTNYSEVAANDKREYLENVARVHARGGVAVDLGANRGVFSRFLAQWYDYVVAADVDYVAVERLYRELKSEEVGNVFPMVLDLGNPSPGIGWGHTERLPFADRCNASYLSALALIHHLVFTAGIPVFKIEEYFFSILNEGGICVLEFVPREDSQVQRLLAAREGVFDDYSLEVCVGVFSRRFDILDVHSVADSCRSIIVMQKRAL